MYCLRLSVVFFAGLAAAAPSIPFITPNTVIPLTKSPAKITSRQSACFIVGSQALPAEVADTVTDIEPKVTCDNSKTTISGVPDVQSGNVKFSSIDFSKSSQTPLGFALSKFATSTPLADTNLQNFTDMLNTYLATEAGIRSVGGSQDIKVPKFFLQMQISRIQTAQGNPPTSASAQVDHQRDKVTKNAAGESKALLDQVTALAAQTS